jgi:hypothetical protein
MENKHTGQQENDSGKREKDEEEEKWTAWSCDTNLRETKTSESERPDLRHTYGFCNGEYMNKQDQFTRMMGRNKADGVNSIWLVREAKNMKNSRPPFGAAKNKRQN